MPTLPIIFVDGDIKIVCEAPQAARIRELEALEQVASTYNKLKKQQEIRLQTLTKGQEIDKAVERKFQKLKQELVELMEGVHLNNARIEALVEQDIHRDILHFYR